MKHRNTGNAALEDPTVVLALHSKTAGQIDAAERKGSSRKREAAEAGSVRQQKREAAERSYQKTLGC